MPTSINGIGTTYYGRRNVETREGTCEHCGAQATLSSYDATHYFIVFFVPLLPLGKKRILDECSSCKRHRVMKLDDWNDAKSQAIDVALASIKENPNDPEVAKQAIGTAASLGVREGLARIAPEVERDHGANAEVMELLGRAQMFLGLNDDAQKTFQAILRQDSDAPGAREGMAELHIKGGRPDEAAPLLRHITTRGEPDKAWLLFQMAEAWQEEGKHDQALHALQQCESLVPSLKDDKAFIKARKLSEKHRGTGKPVKRRKKPAAGRREGNSRLAGWVAAIVGPIVIAGLLGLYFHTAWKHGQERPIHLVNGLSKAYKVRVNGGQTYTLPPEQHAWLTIPEGKTTFEPISEDYDLKPFTLDISTNFFLRPLNKSVYIINPDKSAVIERESVRYIENPSAAELAASDNSYTVEGGRQLYYSPREDYVFEEFPEQLRIKSRSSNRRTRIGQLRGSSFGGNLAMMVALTQLEGDLQGFKAPFMRRFEHEPWNGEVVQSLLAIMGPEEFAGFVEPHLSARPVKVEVHRLWQSLQDAQGEDVEAEYRALLEAEPGSADMLYLAGRVMVDPVEAETLFRRALDVDPDNSYSVRALAYAALANGAFEDGFAHASRAIELGDEQARGLAFSLALAAGRQRDAMIVASPAVQRNPDSIDWVRNKIYAAALGSDPNLAPALVTQYARAFAERSGSRDSEPYKEHFRSIVRAARGEHAQDLESWGAPAEGEEDPWLLLMHHAWKGNGREVLRLGDELSEELDVEFATVVAVFASRLGEADALRGMLEVLTGQLGGTREMRLLASVLAGETEPDHALLRRLPTNVEVKLPMMLLLGELHPEERAAYWELARALNFDRRGWHPIYAGLLDAQE